jgi:hypothetical protein
MLVTVETATAGLNIDNSMDFWEAIERAIYPQDQEQRDRVDELLAEVGIMGPTVTQPSFGVRAEQDGLHLFGRGEIRLGLYVDT